MFSVLKKALPDILSLTLPRLEKWEHPILDVLKDILNVLKIGLYQDTQKRNDYPSATAFLLVKFGKSALTNL